jgi:hypothetical protein
MDSNTPLLSTVTGTTILTVAVIIYRAINKKRCRSSCCGHDLEASIDVGDITPPQERQAHFVTNPLRDKDLPISVIVP